MSFATFTPDNKLVYAITNLGRDKSALVLMDPATCEELEQLYTNDKYDLGGLWYSDAQKKNCWRSYEGHKRARPATSSTRLPKRCSAGWRSTCGL